MINNKPIKVICIICLFIVGWTACKKETKVQFQEPVKDISGAWKIVKLTRNGEDLTSRMDLSSFRIIFNKDNTYTLRGKMAFIVNQPGTYSLNDPQYPFFISFATKNRIVKDTLELVYPIVQGKRQISLNISPGCSKNTYNYVFEKVQK